MIYSYELEKQLLAGLLKEPQALTEICNFISVSDFYSEQSSLNSTIFRIIEQAVNAGEDVDEQSEDANMRMLKPSTMEESA